MCNHSPLLRINTGTYPRRLLVLLTPARFSIEGAKFQIPMRIIFISVREQVVLFHIDHVLGGEGRQGHMKHPCQSESWMVSRARRKLPGVSSTLGGRGIPC